MRPPAFVLHSLLVFVPGPFHFLGCPLHCLLGRSLSFFGLTPGIFELPLVLLTFSLSSLLHFLLNTLPFGLGGLCL